MSCRRSFRITREKRVCAVCANISTHCAAQRAGVKRAFIPKDNEDDLRDVPQEAKDQITVIPVRTVREVLEQTGVLTDEGNALKSA